jgi:PAS domain S-box-containing protein
VEKLRELVAKQNTLFDAPVGIYVVTVNGDFVLCNDRVREILEIPQDSPLPASIQEFYHEPEERDAILEEMRAELNLNTKMWLEKVIRLKVREREKFIKDYTRAIFEPGTGEPIGFLCCMINVTEEILYDRLFESSPVGIYKLDEHGCFVEVSKAVVQMLGYASADEMLGKSIREFFADEDEEKKFWGTINTSDKVDKLVVELKKKNEARWFFSLSAFPVTSDNDEYIGLAGTMTDVNTEELYRRIMEYVPVGLYVIYQRDGKEIISDCNNQFAILNGFERAEQAKGFDIRELHASKQSYDEYIQALTVSGEEPLQGYQLKVRTRQGKESVYEVNSRLLFDSKGNHIGRAGAMRDINEKAAKLRHRIDELTRDFGNVLHTYSQSFVKIQNSLNVVLQSLEPDPFKKGLNLLPERAVRELTQPAARLAKSVEDLTAASNSQWAAGALPPAKWQRLSELSKHLSSYRDTNSPESHPSIVRTIAFKVMELSSEAQKNRLPNDLIRQVKYNAQEILRLCNLISLHQLLDLTLAMEHPIFALREFVTTEMRKQEMKKVVRISSLVSQAVSHLTDFGISRGVDFRHQESGHAGALVEVNERDVIRALDNVLHNAIKYSWERKKGELPWVSINTFVRKDLAHVEIQNWGVPIPKDEIELGRIYETGFRGRLSSDRGRVGTGIGLADARRVAQEHGGSLNVKSIPAGFKAETDYSQPFLTTATITIPLYYNQGAKYDS